MSKSKIKNGQNRELSSSRVCHQKRWITSVNRSPGSNKRNMLRPSSVASWKKLSMSLVEMPDWRLEKLKLILYLPTSRRHALPPFSAKYCAPLIRIWTERASPVGQKSRHHSCSRTDECRRRYERRSRNSSQLRDLWLGPTAILTRTTAPSMASRSTGTSMMRSTARCRGIRATQACGRSSISVSRWGSQQARWSTSSRRSAKNPWQRCNTEDPSSQPTSTL